MVIALGFYIKRKKMAYSIYSVMLFAFLVGVCINVSQEMCFTLTTGLPDVYFS